jgi:anti-sigma B factor antagonist
MSARERDLPLGPEPFRCVVTEERATAVVSLYGELDLATVPEVNALLASLADTPSRLTLDLRGLDFMDSSGLRLVYELDQHAKERGVEFAVVPGGPRIQQVFAMTGLDRSVELVDAPPDD